MIHTRFILIFSLFLSGTLFVGCSAETETSDRGEAVVSVDPEEEASREDPPTEEPVAEAKQPDDQEAIAKIEDMYGEVSNDEDGFVVTVDFGGAFGEKIDLTVLKGVPHTEKLVLNGADVSDEDLVHLKELKSLKSLDLGETRVSDKGMETLLEVPTLQEINLQRTDVTDAGLKILLGIKNLTRFKLVRCKISDAGLALFSDRTDIILLDLKECINVSDAGL